MLVCRLHVRQLNEREAMSESYSSEIPDNDRDEIESALDSAARQDIEEQVAGFLDRLGIGGKLVPAADSGHRALACNTCGHVIGVISGAVVIDGNDIFVSLPTEILNLVCSSMVEHVVNKHTMGWNQDTLVKRNARQN